ncbi:MAG: flavodoxin [Clostridia bacterium]|nr:flavodoxin [Clostridia bacterium]
MNAIVVYKTKYGSTKTYAEWIGEELNCKTADAKEITIDELEKYDTIIYGGGLYAEIINGVILITKNIERLKNKKIAVYTTGITPLDCREYYDKIVVEKNFKNGLPQCIKIFNFTGKMIINELTAVHKAALKTLKKIMSSKKEPTEMEKLLIELCDADGDFCDRSQIAELVKYIVS